MTPTLQEPNAILSASLAERLTLDFYEWEVRGRGWGLWPYPAALEPPYVPFAHGSVAATPVADDGKRSTAASSLARGLTALFRGSRESEAVAALQKQERVDMLPEPRNFADCGPIVEYAVTVPSGSKVGRDPAERLLLSLAACRAPISFEIVGTADSVFIQFAHRKIDTEIVGAQVEAHFPDAVVLEATPTLARRWRTDRPALVVDFGLSEEFMRPLAVAGNFVPDPLTGIIGAFSSLRGDELAVFQVLFQRARHAWAESILSSVVAPDGSPFFADSPEMTSLAREKTARPLFAAVLRISLQTPSESRTVELARSSAGALLPFSRPGSNELIPLTNDGHDPRLHVEDLLERRSHRTGMILNSEELVALVHLPSESVRVPKLLRDTQRTKPAPPAAGESALLLGTNIHRGKRATVELAEAERLRHMHVIGATGTGKSTFLLNCILQDIHANRGVGVIDPHGDLIDEVLGRIPESRHEDVVLFDPADEDYPLGFNVLEVRSELERTLLESDLVSLFRRFTTSWGDQMSSVLGNAVAAFVDSERGGTLIDLRMFLSDQEFRREFLQTVGDPSVLYYWQTEFPLLSGRPQASILTRLGTFLRPKLVRNIVAQRPARLDLWEAMNGGKIFLAKLAHGLIGEDNAYLLGSLIVSKIYQVAIARQSVRQAERRDFFLYIDEFQHFVTPSLASILSGARKYHLGLVLAHQDLHQVSERSSDVLSSVLANAGTRVCFRLGDADAKKLADGFSSFDAKDLQNLGVGEAIARIGRGDQDFNLETPPRPPLDDTAQETIEAVRRVSRERYARPRREVEKTIEEDLARRQATPSPPKKSRSDEPSAPRSREATPPLPASREANRVTPPEDTKALPEARTLPTPGRGGAEHKRIQSFFKRFAEDRGFHSTIESALPGGGSVDIALRTEKLTIACEVSVTSTPEYELQNARKCLEAAFDYVVLVSPDKRTLERVSRHVESELSANELKRVRFLSEQELVGFLEEHSPRSHTTTRGWKVTARRRVLREEDVALRKKTIAEILLRSSKRSRELD